MLASLSRLSLCAVAAPSEWKELFKEATNIAFMVKYMFRESLAIAKTKFTDAVGKKNTNFSGEAHEVVTNLVKETLVHIAAHGGPHPAPGPCPCRARPGGPFRARSERRGQMRVRARVSLALAAARVRRRGHL